MNAFNIIVTHTVNEPYAAENTNESVIVTRGMVRQRAVELAVSEGRKPHETGKADWETAKHEMIGAPVA